ncbi:MAG: hypothetical protein SVU32_01775 [Candidatus Nanohaloarchaea archaeon]|nr:hypothetical protein [Candidatus Nanohaloarchaea archaeon]
MKRTGAGIRQFPAVISAARLYGKFLEPVAAGDLDGSAGFRFALSVYFLFKALAFDTHWWHLGTFDGGNVRVDDLYGVTSDLTANCHVIWFRVGPEDVIPLLVRRTEEDDSVAPDLVIHVL